MSKLALCFFVALVSAAHAATLLSEDRPIKLRLGPEQTPTFTTTTGSALLVTNEGLQLGPVRKPDPTQVLTITGPTTIEAGFVNNGTVIVSASASASLTFAGPVRGAGSFTGDVVFTNSYSPGNSPSTVTLDSPTFGPFNVLTMELGGTVQGTEYDHLIFTGTATLGGTLDVVLINGFNPSPGNSFDLFDGNTTSAFATVNLPMLDAGLTWNTSEFASAGIISVVPEPSSAVLVAFALLGLGMIRRRGNPLGVFLRTRGLSRVN